MDTYSIVVDQLVKRYSDSFIAVDNVSFEVKEGEVFGFLGPNGAGKSTTVSMLTTLTLPSSGKAYVGGYDIVKEPTSVRQIAGVALQEIGVDPLMTANELLRIQIRLFGVRGEAVNKRVNDLLEIVKLSEVADKRLGQYSGGMRRRLDLALALAHRPKILFLDEPTTGLDPASRRDIWEEVRRLNRLYGMTIFLTTQYLEEADELAQRIAIIDGGKIVTEGTPEALKQSIGSESINLTFGDESAVSQAQMVLHELSANTQIDEKSLRIYMKEAATAVPLVMKQLQDANLTVLSLTLSQPTLDDVFLKVTGQRFEAEAAVSI
ncbi:ATP-binding cassette domain-containing protein [Anaerolineales bacterium]